MVDCRLVTFHEKNWNQGKIMELENGQGLVLKIRESQGVCLILENCPYINSNCLVASYFTDFVIFVNWGLGGPIKSCDA